MLALAGNEQHPSTYILALTGMLGLVEGLDELHYLSKRSGRQLPKPYQQLTRNNHATIALGTAHLKGGGNTYSRARMAVFGTAKTARALPRLVPARLTFEDKSTKAATAATTVSMSSERAEREHIRKKTRTGRTNRLRCAFLGRNGVGTVGRGTRTLRVLAASALRPSREYVA
jgi:hypothetical protein